MLETQEAVVLQVSCTTVQSLGDIRMEDSNTETPVPYGQFAGWAFPASICAGVIALWGSLTGGGGNFAGTVVALALNPILWLAIWFWVKSCRLVCPHCGAGNRMTIQLQARPVGAVILCSACNHGFRKPVMKGQLGRDGVGRDQQNSTPDPPGPVVANKQFPRHTHDSEPIVIVVESLEKRTHPAEPGRTSMSPPTSSGLQEQQTLKLPDSQWNPVGDPVVLRTDGSSTHLTLREHQRRGWKEAVRCDFSGVDFRGCSFERADLSGARLDRANFAGCNMRFADLTGVSATTSCFESVDFSGAILRRSNFDSSNLKKAKFCSCDHEVVRAVIEGAEFVGANLSESRFSAASAEGSTEGYPCTVSSANFSFSDLTNAVFVGADLRRCRFLSADLSGSKMQLCNVEGVDFSQSIIINAVFREIKFSGATLFPSGFTPPGSAVNMDMERIREAKASKFLWAAISLILFMIILLLVVAMMGKLGGVHQGPADATWAPGHGELVSESAPNRSYDDGGSEIESADELVSRLGIGHWQTSRPTPAVQNNDGEIVRPSQTGTEPVGMRDLQALQAASDAILEFNNSIGAKFVLVPAGTFLMGANSGNKSSADEKVHRVTLTSHFYLSSTEVTQAQWEAVMGSTPWTAVKLARVGEKYPAVGISWYDATAFCARLSLIEGLKYRLPTEAEWEYACRAGSQMNFGFGDNQAMLDQYAWFGGSETGYEYLQAVALRMPNRWGLFDMHGNAWEWCNDWYGEYEFASAVDPVGPAKGSSRVLRGGYLVNRPSSLRSAFRNFFPPDRASFNVGFRLAVSVPTDPE